MQDGFENWALLVLAVFIASSVVGYWIIETLSHDARLARIPIRVHVNGIRGKSTIVRYIAAALRAGGIQTIAKTTGSATRLIAADGSETPVNRSGAPTILEQIKLLRQAARPDTQAIVFECMALNTDYQRISERRMIRATDGVIANVRLDHVAELGNTRAKIAASLANTVPASAPLYTSDGSADIRQILGDAAQRRNGSLVYAKKSDVTEAEMKPFGPLAFRENVALALAIAERHGVARADALRGMAETQSDPGASSIHCHEDDGREIFWINLFSVNDIASAQLNIDRITEWIGPESDLIFVLNAREDRQERTLQFVDLLARMTGQIRIALIGQNRHALREAIKARDIDPQFVDLDLSQTSSAAELGQTLGGTNRVALVGLANIHTADASKMRKLLETPQSRWPKAQSEAAVT